MSSINRVGLVLVAAFAVACSQAKAPLPDIQAGKGPPPQSSPIKPPSPDYSAAPEPIRTYLLKAREASLIADPLQRCLAFPVLPGTHWPDGLIEAHCEYALGPRPSQNEVAAHIDAGDVVWLEKTFRGLLDRHFSDTDFSEHIHDLFDYFTGDYESGRLTQRWLELAPDSPFALTARGNFYQQLGWAARGEDSISETPPEQIAQMDAHRAKALAFYKQALAKEPRMLDAYIGMVDLGRNDGKPGAAAFEAGRKVDPACKVLMSARMNALLPRWGGSYDEMLALEKQMLPYMQKRPLLALSRVWSYVDLANVLWRAERYDDAVAALRPMIPVSSSPQVQEDLASAMDATHKFDRWQVLAYAVAGKRFRTGRPYISRLRGMLEMDLAHDFDLANFDLANAVSLTPDNAITHSYYAMSLDKNGKVDEAEREYLLAMKYDSPTGQNYKAALFALSHLMSNTHHDEKALSYAQRAVNEFPKDHYAWRSLAEALATAHAPLEQRHKAVEQYLLLIDRKDPLTVGDLAYAESMLQQVEAEEKRKP